MTAATDVILFSNNKSALLNNDVAGGDVSIVLAAGQGSTWPSPVAGQYCVVTIQDLVTGNFEVCHVTSRTGDILSVERAKEGTVAQAFTVANSVVQMRVTKGILEKMIQRLFTGADAGKFLQVQADGSVIPALGGSGVPDSRQVATTNSLTGGGTLNVDRTLQLVNDTGAPGADKVYGTDAGGVRGWRTSPAPAGVSYLANNEVHTAGKSTAPITINANAGGTVTLDCSLSNAFVVQVNSDITLAVSNYQDGQTINVVLVQGAAYTVTWAANTFKWPGQSVPTFSATAGAIDMLSARRYGGGSRLLAVLSQDFG